MGAFVAVEADAGTGAVGRDEITALKQLQRQGYEGTQVLLRVGQDWTHDLLTRL
jgi:hypothetical protein